jgi:aspartyl aminopeptidase
MKKINLVFFVLFLNVSVFVSAQNANAATPQKPSKEDFFHTWVTQGGEGLGKYSCEVTFKNESSYTLIFTHIILKPKLNYIILKWEEAVNTFDYAEEYPYGFIIRYKEDNNRSEGNFYMFINADKTKYLVVSVIDLIAQYNIYTKK